MADPKTVLEFAKKNGAKLLDLRFTDLPGLWQHVSYPINQLTEDSFEEGFGMDGSSIRGWAAINESDMLLIPDPSRFWLDPFASEPTIVLIANVVDPITKEGYGLDPRSVAVRAESYLKFTGVADTVRNGRCSCGSPPSTGVAVCQGTRLSAAGVARARIRTAATVGEDVKAVATWRSHAASAAIVPAIW